MKYFKAPDGEIFGYDETDQIQTLLIADAMTAGWEDITESWPPPAIPVVPYFITRPQCALQLLDMKLITEAEAIAMATIATPPQVVEAMIKKLPAADQVKARIDFARYYYERANPLVNAMVSGEGKTSADGDDFFRAASKR